MEFILVSIHWRNAVKITTKELRLRPGKIIDRVINGQEITVTFRGKSVVKIVPIKQKTEDPDSAEASIFWLWKEHTGDTSVDNYVRQLRRGRRL